MIIFPGLEAEDFRLAVLRGTFELMPDTRFVCNGDGGGDGGGDGAGDGAGDGTGDGTGAADGFGGFGDGFGDGWGGGNAEAAAAQAVAGTSSVAGTGFGGWDGVGTSGDNTAAAEALGGTSGIGTGMGDTAASFAGTSGIGAPGAAFDAGTDGVGGLAGGPAGYGYGAGWGGEGTGYASDGSAGGGVGYGGAYGGTSYGGWSDSVGGSPDTGYAPGSAFAPGTGNYADTSFGPGFGPSSPEGPDFGEPSTPMDETVSPTSEPKGEPKGTQEETNVPTPQARPAEAPQPNSPNNMVAQAFDALANTPAVVPGMDPTSPVGQYAEFSGLGAISGAPGFGQGQGMGPGGEPAWAGTFGAPGLGFSQSGFGPGFEGFSGPLAGMSPGDPVGQFGEVTGLGQNGWGTGWGPGGPGTTGWGPATGTTTGAPGAQETGGLYGSDPQSLFAEARGTTSTDPITGLTTTQTPNTWVSNETPTLSNNPIATTALGTIAGMTAGMFAGIPGMMSGAVQGGILGSQAQGGQPASDPNNPGGPLSGFGYYGQVGAPEAPAPSTPEVEVVDIANTPQSVQQANPLANLNAEPQAQPETVSLPDVTVNAPQGTPQGTPQGGQPSAPQGAPQGGQPSAPQGGQPSAPQGAPQGTPQSDNAPEGEAPQGAPQEGDQQGGQQGNPQSSAPVGQPGQPSAPIGVVPGSPADVAAQITAGTIPAVTTPNTASPETIAPPASGKGSGGGSGGGTDTGTTAAAKGAQGGQVSEDQGKVASVRTGSITPSLKGILSKAGKAAGVNVSVRSGGQRMAGAPGHTGSHRHDQGKAADIQLTDAKDGHVLSMANPNDRARMAQFARAAKAAGATGIGAGHAYMGDNTMHVGFGTPSVWGAGGKSSNAPNWLTTALSGTKAGKASAGGAPGTTTGAPSQQSAIPPTTPPTEAPGPQGREARTPLGGRYTFYAPGTKGKMEGGFNTALPNPEKGGKNIPTTMDDVLAARNAGKNIPVTLAGRNAHGQVVPVGTVSWTGRDGKVHTLNSVQGRVIDRGGFTHGKGKYAGRENNYDIATFDARGQTDKGVARSLSKGSVTMGPAARTAPAARGAPTKGTLGPRSDLTTPFTVAAGGGNPATGSLGFGEGEQAPPAINPNETETMGPPGLTAPPPPGAPQNEPGRAAPPGINYGPDNFPMGPTNTWSAPPSGVMAALGSMFGVGQARAGGGPGVAEFDALAKTQILPHVPQGNRAQTAEIFGKMTDQDKLNLLQGKTTLLDVIGRITNHYPMTIWMAMPPQARAGLAKAQTAITGLGRSLSAKAAAAKAAVTAPPVPPASIPTQQAALPVGKGQTTQEIANELGKSAPFMQGAVAPINGPTTAAPQSIDEFVGMPGHGLGPVNTSPNDRVAQGFDALSGFWSPGMGGPVPSSVIAQDFAQLSNPGSQSSQPVGAPSPTTAPAPETLGPQDPVQQARAIQQFMMSPSTFGNLSSGESQIMQNMIAALTKRPMNPDSKQKPDNAVTPDEFQQIAQQIGHSSFV